MSRPRQLKDLESSQHRAKVFETEALFTYLYLIWIIVVWKPLIQENSNLIIGRCWRKTHWFFYSPTAKLNQINILVSFSQLNSPFKQLLPHNYIAPNCIKWQKQEVSKCYVSWTGFLSSFNVLPYKTKDESIP